MGAEREDQPPIVAAVPECFQRYGTRKRVQTAAAVLLWNRESLQADLAALAP